PDTSFPLQPGDSKKEPVSSLEQVLKEVRRRVLGPLGTGVPPSPGCWGNGRSLPFPPGSSLALRAAGSGSALGSPSRCLFSSSGLIPRLLGDILSLWLCNMLAYLINTYALENGVRAAAAPWRLKAPFLPPQVSTMTEMKSYSQAVTGFFASMLTYPFVLVSNLMAVNNCGLAGGLLPYAPTYSSWLDCWSQLRREGNMSRGNSLFFRKVPAGKRYVWE
ncbi:MTCH2 protein, partial [Stercorarius parasiticus]|nr:MTCH2 protein [Stercorarius parasiticus]